MGRIRNMGNAYGLPKWQFQALRAKYNALPQEEKEKIAKAERNAFNSVMESQYKVIGKCEKCGGDLTIDAFGNQTHVQISRDKEGNFVSASMSTKCKEAEGFTVKEGF
jgi:hypothetical protein